MFHVGPCYTGVESFDEHCIFGNEVEIDVNQVLQLSRIVETMPRPPIKAYVCRMEKSFINPGQMVGCLISTLLSCC